MNVVLFGLCWVTPISELPRLLLFTSLLKFDRSLRIFKLPLASTLLRLRNRTLCPQIDPTPHFYNVNMIAPLFMFRYRRPMLLKISSLDGLTLIVPLRRY